MGWSGFVCGVASRCEARRVAVIYFLIQGIAVAGWWLLLLFVPGSRALFFPEELSGGPLLSFWLADAFLMIAGSLIVAFMLIKKLPAAASGAWLLSGAASYAALYCLGVSLWYGGGELGVGAMFVSAGLTLAMASVIGPMDGEPAGFRANHDRSVAWVAVKAGLQIVVFWGTFLGVLPFVIARLQAQAGLALFSFPGQVVIGLGALLLTGSLGLWSTWVTIKLGGGTPLPTDCASTLVTAGPYQYVRNPMALAGILQGLCAGAAWGSVAVMIYAVVGGLFWHFAVRPIEEQDLAQRFGEPYERYRRAVRCWIPQLSGKSREMGESGP